MTRSIRVFILTVLTGVLVLSGLTFAVPDSSAQADPPPLALAVDIVVPVGTPCPTDTSSVGTITGSAEGGRFDGTYCRPNGFGPLRDQMICESLTGFATWLDDGSLAPICAYDGYSIPGALACPAPLALGQGTAPSGVFSFWCLAEVLVEGSGSGIVSAGAPVCIESPLVAEVAPTGQVGTRFSADGVDYLIHTGPPTCEANCHGGFDFNCDDVLGDFCAVELDLNTVAGINECIDAMALDEADDAVPAESPAPASADPQVIVLGTGGGVELAHTGAESGMLAFLGLGLVGFGATALGLRRRQDS